MVRTGIPLLSGDKEVVYLLDPSCKFCVLWVLGTHFLLGFHHEEQMRSHSLNLKKLSIKKFISLLKLSVL